MAKETEKKKIHEQWTDEERMAKYATNEQLFRGNAFKAFSHDKTRTDAMRARFGHLRYVAVNFAGMLSRLNADMLFGFEEFPHISFADEKAAEFFEALSKENNLPVQLYESALSNSFRGDAVFRIRSTEDSQLIIEDFNPESYFAHYNKGNVRDKLTGEGIQWVKKVTDSADASKTKDLCFQETHTKGLVETVAFYIDKSGQQIGEALNEDELKEYGLVARVETKIEQSLIIHIPNTRINSTFYGIDDYEDLKPLMFAINNRMTQVDNVLDKHGDPILAVPTGVINEKGQVDSMAFGLIELGDDETNKEPKYIVWDAKLESTFDMIDKLVEFLFITSETSLAAFGLDKEGQAESGRALKFKMLRTLAKKHRKQLYYDSAIKKLLMVAQEFASKNSLKCGDVAYTGDAELPEIEWQDGIINDEVELMDVEERKLTNSVTSRKDVIKRVENVTDEQAEERIKEIDEDAKAQAPAFDANPFNAEDPENKKKDKK